MIDDYCIAVMGIIVEGDASTTQLNNILSNYAEFIIGRMGIPYRQRGVSILSVALDAPQDKLSAIAGKIGALPGIKAKITYGPSLIPKTKS